MNTARTSEKEPRLLSRMVVRLWAIMMVLVLLSIAFIWIVQISLFERNFVQSTVAEVQSRLEPIMEDLKTEDLASNDSLIPYLSKSTNGKMFLLDVDGNLLALYTYGHPIDLQEANTANATWLSIQSSEDYGSILRREQYKKIYQTDQGVTAFEIGIPATYDGREAYVVLYHQFTEMHTVLQSNRRQLVTLSVILTITAAALAGILSRQFTRPIRKIRDSVDRLAGGELDAAPNLCRRDELGQLSDSVEELGQALQRVDVLRKEVIANVSHELRSPLALIIGYSEMVRDISWSDEKTRTENMNLIITEARRMSEMVSDIMDYSQFQAGYIQLKQDWYNLFDIVECETAHCRQSAEEHDIRIALVERYTDITVLVDALKISQVMRNLLYNAINHTIAGETISVSIEEEHGDLLVCVENPGESIPEEEQEAIWERYHRSQHQGGRRQGTGLGLSIVSTILRAHGMTYGVDSSDNRTKFWFRCPKELRESRKAT